VIASAVVHNPVMNRRCTVAFAALLTLALTGCKATGTTAMAATPQVSAIALTPSPSIPDAQKSARWYTVTAHVGTLVVDGKIGNITVMGSNRSGVEVIAEETYSSTPPDITRTVSGGTLTVGYTCPMRIPCIVTFVIKVPSGIAVRAANETGSIWLKNLAGAATAKSGAGSIYASGLTTQTASFTTGVGWIRAAFASPPAEVAANTMLGTIELQVPVTAAYRLTMNAVGGRITVSVPQGTATARTITASTNLGNVYITPSQLSIGITRLAEVSNLIMNRRYSPLLVAVLALMLAGCKASATVSAPSTTIPAADLPSPSLSIPGTHTSVHGYTIAADVSMLVVDGQIGDITVVGSNRSGAEVVTQAAYSSTAPTITRTVSGTTLTVGYTCAMQIACGVAFVIAVPSGTAVHATTDTGAIRLTGLAGPVRAKADAGLIDASGLTAQSASFSTDVGGIDVTFTSPPRDVTAGTRVGAITIRVPVTVAYRVTANAIVGRVTVSVPPGAGAARTITARTDVGSVSVTPS